MLLRLSELACQLVLLHCIHFIVIVRICIKLLFARFLFSHTL